MLGSVCQKTFPWLGSTILVCGLCNAFAYHREATTQEMGRRGAKVLLERISERDKEPTSEIVMSPELVVRESTGPAKGLD